MTIAELLSPGQTLDTLIISLLQVELQKSLQYTEINFYTDIKEISLTLPDWTEWKV